MEENRNAPRYFIDLEADADRRGSAAALIAQRRCYACRQADTEESALTTDPQEYVARITEQCADTPDFLLPDNPLKESVFKVILAGGNEPKTAEEISEFLSARWELTAYPRDLSPAVIGKLLEHSQSYRIAALPEPEAED